MMFAKYFEYYTIILRGGAFFVDTLYVHSTVMQPNNNDDSLLPWAKPARHCPVLYFQSTAQVSQ